MLPRANNFDRTFTQGQFNYSTQENADNPKMNNVVRVDWRPTANDSFYFTFKDWYSDQRGSEITAGPNKWGFFNTHYLNTDRGVSANYAKIIRVEPRPRHRLRHAPADRAVLPADRRRLGADQPRQRRLHARPVPSGAEPAQRRPESELQRPERAELHVRQPAGRSGRGVADVIAHQPDVDQGQPLDQGRATTSSSRGTRRATAASAPGPWAGQFTFNTDTNNPFDTNYSYANALIGSFQQLHRDRRLLRGHRASATSRSSTCRTPGRPTAPDARLRPALPLVHAVVLDAAGRRVRARALRSGEGAAALPAGADQQRQRRVRSGDRA